MTNRQVNGAILHQINERTIIHLGYAYLERDNGLSRASVESADAIPVLEDIIVFVCEPLVRPL